MDASGFVCIGHLSSLLQGSPILKLSALLLPWTLLYVSVGAPCFIIWKELSLYPWTHPSPSLSGDGLVYYAFSVGGIVSVVLLPSSYWWPLHSLDQNLNSHRSGIQEFWEICLIKMNDCILSNVNCFLLFSRTL